MEESTTNREEPSSQQNQRQQQQQQQQQQQNTASLSGFELQTRNNASSVPVDLSSQQQQQRRQQETSTVRHLPASIQVSSSSHQSQLRRQAHAVQSFVGSEIFSHFPSGPPPVSASGPPPLHSQQLAARTAITNPLSHQAFLESEQAMALPQVESASSLTQQHQLSDVDSDIGAAGIPDLYLGQSRFRSQNPYYEGQRRALQNDAMASDPELAQPGSPVHQASCGWSTVETLGTAPCERSLHSACVFNGSLYVFGGYNGSARINDMHCYNFASHRWSPVLPAANSDRPPSPRDRHTSVVHGSIFYVFGGFDGTSRTSSFHGFDFSSMTWREIQSRSGRPPSERHSHSAVVWGNSMFVFGGYDGSYKSDLHEFDFSLSKWSIVPAAGRRPRARYRATAVVHKHLMIVHGGHDGTRHLNDTHVFDFDAHSWSALLTEGTPPIPRDSHVSVCWNGAVFIFGGSSGSAMNDLHELQLPSNPNAAARWRQVKSSSTDQPGHRFCHVAAVHQDQLYVFGGYDGSERLNDFIRFDLSAYDLNFDVPPSTLIADLRHLVNDDTLSDITFIVDEQPVYAHKLLLMRCSYFRALFLGDMRESRLSSIHIEQVRHPIFTMVLEYLYTDSLLVPLDSAMELFEAADLFCIPRLKTMCEKTMLQSITVENAAHVFYAADMHTASSLRRKALKYILSHFEDVSKTEAFEEMGRSNMELIFEILRNR